MNLSEFNDDMEFEQPEEESETLLSELPLSIITGSIETQFKDPMEYSKHDFVQSFITKYKVTKESIESEEEAEELRQLYLKFIRFMENIFHERLHLGLPELDDMGESEQLELIHYLYSFFIMNIKKNFTTLIMNYIDENRKELFEQLPKRKDVRTASLKQIVTDPIDLSIVVNIAKVIDIISSNPFDVDEFLEFSKGDDADVENEYINEKYDEFIVNGNFVEPYFFMLSDTFRIEVECKVRNKILKKYRKKKE